jgi:hypothetical protein
VAVGGEHIYWSNNRTGTIGVANLDGTGVNQSYITGANVPVGLAVSVPVATPSATNLSFAGTTPRGSLSSPRTLTVTNNGQRELSLTGLSFTGADPGDFFVTSDTCLGDVLPGSSCQLEVSFSPQAQGARAATLQIASTDYANGPLQIGLSGSGGTLPTGSTGSTGSTGPTSPAGAPGAQAPAGKLELLTCQLVTKKVKLHKRRVQRCTGRLLSATVRITPAAAGVRAAITRGQREFAIGASVAMRGGRSELVLEDLRPLHRGRYTLTLRRRHGRRTVITRQQIVID